MRYNKELLEKLLEIFGEEVIGWSRDKVRIALSDEVDKVHSLSTILKTAPKRRDAFKIFIELSEVEDEFLELYINKLDKK